eukprot:1191358-Prorocentrum_minimum.AAC.4
MGPRGLGPVIRAEPLLGVGASPEALRPEESFVEVLALEVLARCGEVAEALDAGLVGGDEEGALEALAGDGDPAELEDRGNVVHLLLSPGIHSGLVELEGSMGGAPQRGEVFARAARFFRVRGQPDGILVLVGGVPPLARVHYGCLNAQSQHLGTLLE